MFSDVAISCDPAQASEYYKLAQDHLAQTHVRDLGVRIHGAGEYPAL